MFNTRHVLKLLLAAILVMALSCKEEKTKLDTPPIAFSKEGELSVYQGESDSLKLKIDIEIADTDYETQTGLMYREGLESDRGMFFIFDDESYHSFYMKNTRFPIDIIFIDKDLQIVTIKENAIPLDETGISSEVPVQYVLEVKAGIAGNTGMEIGDRVVYSRIGQ